MNTYKNKFKKYVSVCPLLIQVEEEKKTSNHCLTYKVLSKAEATQRAGFKHFLPSHSLAGITLSLHSIFLPWILVAGREGKEGKENKESSLQG